MLGINTEVPRGITQDIGNTLDDPHGYHVRDPSHASRGSPTTTHIPRKIFIISLLERSLDLHEYPNKWMRVSSEEV